MECQEPVEDGHIENRGYEVYIMLRGRWCNVTALSVHGP
jgi:hypothetical protein